MTAIINGDLLEAHWREDVLNDGYLFGSRGTIERDLKPKPGEHLDCSGGVLDNTAESLVSGPLPWGSGDRPTAEELRHLSVPRVGPMKRGDVVFLLDSTGHAHHVGQAITDTLIAEARSAYLPEGEQLQIHDLAYWRGRSGFDGPRYFPGVEFRTHAEAKWRIGLVLPAATAHGWTVAAQQLGLAVNKDIYSKAFIHDRKAMVAWCAIFPDFATARRLMEQVELAGVVPRFAHPIDKTTSQASEYLGELIKRYVA